MHYTGNIYIYFTKSKRVSRSEHGRGADELKNNLEHEGGNSFIQNGNGCFLKRINYILKKDFTKDVSEFIQSFKTRTDVMTRYRIPQFCKKNKINFGIPDDKIKRIFARSLNQRNLCLYNQ